MHRMMLAGVCLAALAAPAAAQDINADPNYGQVTLNAGFDTDPRTVTLRAGGNIDASRIDNCRGYITAAPDYRVNYSAGSFPLYISVAADSDTTLIVTALTAAGIATMTGASKASIRRFGSTGR